MKQRFPYKKIKPAEGKRPAVIRPIIPIELAAKNKERVRTEALIDSGADMSLFNWEIAEILGFKEKDALDKKPFQGVLGKPKDFYVFEVIMILGGSSKFMTKCGFTKHLPDGVHGFLGQESFFSQYKIEFVYKKELIKIRDNNN